MKLTFFLFLLLVCLTSHSLPTEDFVAKNTETLTLTTFNIKWFGLSGSMWNDPGSEFRQNYLKRFVDQELPTSDVIVFVEVSDPKLLSDTFSYRFECVTYERESTRHQRVVTCFNPNKYRVEKYDEDYIVPEVALESTGLRPATQMKLCRKNGDCFLQLIGVHLVAGSKTPLRLEQIELLSADLKKQSNSLPTAIAGDFNSYVTEQSGLEEDDITAFEKILSSAKRNFKTLNTGINTYGAPEWGKAYDHIVVTDDIKATSVRGYRACEKSADLNEQFIPFYSYSRYFSDHCPLTAELVINH